MIRSLDLFAGAGGLTLGVHQAGFDTVAAVEIDAYSAETFSRHSPTTDVIHRDVKNIQLSAFRKRIDVVIGGPPCQPFSSGGLRTAHSDKRNMIPEFIRAIDVLRPEAFLMENVPGLVVGERLLYFNKVIQAFQSFGYNVVWKVLPAVNYGVPQKRRRLFMVGMKDHIFQFPVPSHGPNTNRPYVTVKDVLPRNQLGEPNFAAVTYAKKPDLRPSPFDGLIFNGGGRPINRAEPAHTILASAGGNKTHFFDDLNIVPEYHRYLMAGGEPRLGEVPGTRRLTVLESAILQTFPRSVRFYGPRSAQYRQIGNAVPPELARVVAQSLAEQLNSKPTVDKREFYFVGQAVPLFDSLGATMSKSTDPKGRNIKVEQAVLSAIVRIDHFLSGGELELPNASYRKACDVLLGKSASVRTAGLFLAFYTLQEADWTYNSLPSGARGTFGDKLLCEELSKRDITLHNNIKAYGENLGWKGNVSSGTVNLEADSRFRDFVLGVRNAQTAEKMKIADYLAQKFAESRRVTAPLPPVSPDVLTFARAKLLFDQLINTASEGHIQQFLIAALLREHRRRLGNTITTHHPHAADEYDGTAGDIEERQDGELVRAYEVTVRSDWQNRISGFRAKMDRFNLKKYVIIASGINLDRKWAEPANMLTNLEPYGRDIAVVDIHDVVNVFTAELSAQELRAAVNGAFADLCNPKLSNRDDFKTVYQEVVSNWLDTVGPQNEES